MILVTDELRATLPLSHREAPPQEPIVSARFVTPDRQYAFYVTEGQSSPNSDYELAGFLVNKTRWKFAVRFTIAESALATGNWVGGAVPYQDPDHVIREPWRAIENFLFPREPSLRVPDWEKARACRLDHPDVL